MLLTVALGTALVVNAADVKSEAWVVVTKRSGVAKAAAVELAKAASDTLGKNGVPNPTEPADLTSCNAKLACLVDAALKKKVAVLVAIEAASVLDDVVIHAEALSIEEDGKKLGSIDYEGPAKQLNVEGLVAPIRAALGISPAPVAKPAEPAKDPVAAAPEPAPAPAPKPVEAPVASAPVEVKPKALTSGMRGTQLVGVVVTAVGVLGLGTAAGLGAKSMIDAGKKNQLCPPGKPCTLPGAYSAYTNAANAQNQAVPLAVIGGVLVAGGVVLLLVDFGGGGGVKAAPAVSPDGAGAVLTGSF